MKIIVAKKVNNILKPSEITDLILKNRNIDNFEEFLHPTHPNTFNLQTFGYKKQANEIIKKLEVVKKNNEVIVVYMDYDADGITGGTIMWETLHILGFTVHPYIPNRVTEGYGFSIHGIDMVKDIYNPRLIITVDHGIAAHDKVTYAHSLGIEVIITDHHNKGTQDPDCITVHIPKLCGSAVSYLVAKEIYLHFDQNNTKLKSLFETDYLALSATGTIADLVPLTNYNRSFAYYGLKAYDNVSRPGLFVLKKAAGITNKTTSFDVGYKIAPRINALGRIADAMDSLRLLCTNNLNRAQELIHTVNTENTHRQDLVTISVEEAIDYVQTTYKDTLPNMLLIVNENWHEGVVGLIASKIVEKFYRPTIIVTSNEHNKNILKGSARSIKGFHMTEFLQKNLDILISAGGHEQAAGLSLDKCNLVAFKKVVEEENINNNLLEKEIIVDIEAPLDVFTIKLYNELSLLEPYGMGNIKPLFLITGTVLDKKIMGKNNNVIKYTLGSDTYKIPLLFFAEHIQKDVGENITVIANLDSNTWNNKIEVQLIGKYFI